MTRARRETVSQDFDPFLPYLADLGFRDQREMMERPFFSLAKSKRVKPIDYQSPDGKLWVHVSANPDYGMATIWDADILIYCASVLADMARRGVNDVPRKIHLMPYDLLRAIGNLAVASGNDGAAHTERMVMLLLDGLRYGAKTPK